MKITDLQIHKTNFNGTTRIMVDAYGPLGSKISNLLKDVKPKIQERPYDLFVSKDKYVKKEGFFNVFLQKPEEYINNEKPKTFSLIHQDKLEDLPKIVENLMAKKDKTLVKKETIRTKIKNFFKRK